MTNVVRRKALLTTFFVWSAPSLRRRGTGRAADGNRASVFLHDNATLLGSETLSGVVDVDRVLAFVEQELTANCVHAEDYFASAALGQLKRKPGRNIIALHP